MTDESEERPLVVVIWRGRYDFAARKAERAAEAAGAVVLRVRRPDQEPAE